MVREGRFWEGLGFLCLRQQEDSGLQLNNIYLFLCVYFLFVVYPLFQSVPTVNLRVFVLPFATHLISWIDCLILVILLPPEGGTVKLK